MLRKERLLASLSDAEKEALLSGQTQVPTNMLLNDSTLHALLYVIQIRCPKRNLARSGVIAVFAP